MLETTYKITILQETVNDESVRIISWKVPSGGIVVADQLICEIETSKTVLEIHTPVAGRLDYHFSVGDEVGVGDTICEIAPELHAPSQLTANGNSHFPDKAAELPSPADDLPVARLTPLARKIAAEYKIDISSFPKGSLVRKNDVLRKAGLSVVELSPPEWSETPQARKSHSSSVAVIPSRGVPLEWRELPRKKIIEGKILGSGRAACIQSSVTTSVRAPGLRMRAAKLELPTTGFDALILFEVARLLRKFPVLNAVYDSGKIGEYQDVNIGWAVDGGDGLVVPVVKSCDRKGVREIGTIMEGQVAAYLESSLAPADLAGGTFTVSNLSSHGVHFCDPLISQGQSAILGIGSDAYAQAGELFYLTLAFDHQLAEGRTAAQFLGELSVRLESHSSIEDFRAMESPKVAADPFCVLCHRDKQTLDRYKAILLKSEIPAGLVCSLCISGF